ncbi:MAG: hypothetical protein QOG94_1017 [Solirubrobacteraceae bacterium]|jgi:hypothetical protein|nr:hypothetical protein [Solirubrobacteraceae bacterium]
MFFVSQDGDLIGPGADLATMLAEMDGRLRVLQQELETAALPVARRSPELRAAQRRQLAQAAAEPQPGDETASGDRSGPPPDASGPAARRPRPVRAARSAAGGADASRSTDRPPRTVVPDDQGWRTRPRTQQASAVAEPEAAPPTALPGEDVRDVTGAGRRANRIKTVARAGADVATRETEEAAVHSTFAEGVVRQTILAAEEEARHVVEDARRRIADIGVRTRALLGESLAEPRQPAKLASSSSRRARTATVAGHAYQGAVRLEAGPFAEVAQVEAFEDAIASIPGVEDLHLCAFERDHALFQLRTSQPTLLVVELQARTTDSLSVIAAGDRDVRLEIVRDDGE